MGYISFELDEEAAETGEFISNLDEIGRSIGNAVTQSVAAPLLQRPPLTKPVPKAPLRDLLFNKHMREGNLPALFADLAAKHGPVFEMTPPFQKERTIYLASPETNQWAHKHGRMHFRAKEYFQRLEENLRRVALDPLNGRGRPLPLPARPCSRHTRASR